MKIDVLILAGGIGSRMGTKEPKQFISVNRVPILVRTINNFQINPRINKIVVVCVKSHINKVRELVHKFKLTKVSKVIEGGDTSHDSTRNGIFALKDTLKNDDFVIIHDAVRPILPQQILDEMINIALEKGNACLAVPCYETVVLSSNGKEGNKDIDRNTIMRVQTPQMYQYGLIKSLYEKAEKDGLHNFVYANTLAIHYGETIYFSRGFNYNYKITTKDDIPLYKALLKFSDEELSKR